MGVGAVMFGVGYLIAKRKAKKKVAVAKSASVKAVETAPDGLLVVCG